MKKILILAFLIFHVSVFAQNSESAKKYVYVAGDTCFTKAASGEFNTPEQYCEATFKNFGYYERFSIDEYGRCVLHMRYGYGTDVCQISKKEVEENKCTAIAGKFTKLSVPAGWVHVDSTGEMRDFKPSGSAPDKVCKGGCQYLLMSNEVVPGSTVYAPKINNGGYHPVFSQFTYAGSDTQCQAETDLSTPSTPPPEKPKEPEEPKKPEEPFTCPTGQCPGVANGQQICVPCNSGPGKGSGDGDKDGKDKEGSDKKADSKADPASSAASSAGNGNGNGSNGQSNENGTGNGHGSGGGAGSGSGSKSDSTGKRPGESEGDDDGPPPQYGERPELYEPKYKDGVKGVWDEKKGQLKDTKLAQLAKKLMPKENKGDCPKWQIDMNWGKGMSFGLLNLAPPCAIWPVLRAIVMVCALLLARRLVFGG